MRRDEEGMNRLWKSACEVVKVRRLKKIVKHPFQVLSGDASRISEGEVGMSLLFLFSPMNFSIRV